jgi:uncharacterized protein (DUF2141 family)
MNRLAVLLGVVMLYNLTPAAEGWDLVTSYYRSVGVTSYSHPVIVDIDADNDPDIFVGSYYGTISFFRNDGTAALPTFNVVDSSFDSINVGYYCAPAFADIDGDNDLDLFVGKSDGSISFYRNDGTASAHLFHLVDERYYQIDVGSNSCPVFMDLDGDNDLDMLVGTSGGTISHYRNEGTAQAAYWNLVTALYDSIDVGSNCAPTLVDIDADSDLDLFIGNSGGTIAFYRNDGTTLAPSWNLIDANYFMIDIGSYSVPAFGDIDGDNDFDLFIGESAGNLNYHRNEGTAQAQYFATVSTSYSAITAGTYSAPVLFDVDKDGDPDLTIGQGDGSLLYFKNIGTRSLPLWQQDNAVVQAIDVGDQALPAYADIDGDGDYDLFIGNADGTISFYRNTGSASAPAYTLETATYNSINVGTNAAPTFADIDGDNDLDMFVGRYTGTINFYRNEGTTLAPSWNLVTSSFDTIDVGYNSVPVFADIDNDNDLDLFVGGSGGQITFYYNNGTALAPLLVRISSYYGSIDIGSYAAPAFGDLDGDNDLDMLIGKSDGYLAHYRNNGALDYLYWYQVTNYFLNIDVGSNAHPAFADIDGDNDLDMFVGNSTGRIWYYRNDGSVGNPACTLITNWYDSIDVGSYSAPTFVDIDNDGDQDLMVGKSDGRISFYRNDGTALSPSWNLIDANYFNITVSSYSAPAFVDIDNDGDQDLFIGTYNGRLYFYRNEGTAASPYWKQESTYYGSIDIGSNSVPAFYDIDHDGDFDLFLGEQSGNINFYINDSTAEEPKFVLDVYNYNAIDVGSNSAPVFADLDGDGLIGLFAGNSTGRIYYWEALNKPTPVFDLQPAWVKSAPGAVRCIPNPVKDIAWLQFDLAKPERVTISLYDLAGTRHTVLSDALLPAGPHSISFSWVKPGLVVYQIQAGPATYQGQLIKAE